MMKGAIAFIGVLAHSGCHALAQMIDPNVLNTHELPIPLEPNGRAIDSWDTSGQSPHFSQGNQYLQEEGQSSRYDHLYGSVLHSQGAENPLTNIDPGRFPEHLLSLRPPHPHHLGEPYQTSQFSTPLFKDVGTSMAQSHDNQPPLQWIPPREDPVTSINDAENVMTQSYDHIPFTQLITDYEVSYPFWHDQNTHLNDAEAMMIRSHEEMLKSQRFPDLCTSWNDNNVKPEPDISYGRLPTAEGSSGRLSSPVPSSHHSPQDTFIFSSMPSRLIFDETAFDLKHQENNWYVRCLANAIKHCGPFPRLFRINEDAFTAFVKILRDRNGKEYEIHMPTEISELPAEKRSYRMDMVRRNLMADGFNVLSRNSHTWFQFFNQKSGVYVETYIPHETSLMFRQNFLAYLFFVEMINETVPQRGARRNFGKEIIQACQMFQRFVNPTPELRDSKVWQAVDKYLHHSGDLSRQTVLWHCLEFWMKEHRTYLFNKLNAQVKGFFNGIFILCAEKLTARLATYVNQNQH